MLPMPEKGNTLLIQIALQSYDENGFPDDEAAILEQIGNALSVSLDTETDASYVGFIAGGQMCTFCFCIGLASAPEHFILETMQQFSEYEYAGSNLLEDDNWDIYTGGLFPAHQYYERINDSAVVTRFEEGGDPLTKPRTVDHWCYFRNESDRTRFIEIVRQEGFHVEGYHDDGSGEFTFGVQLSRVDLVDRENLFKYTSYLWNLAYEHYGDYDGWGALGEKE
jgi:hypothetical protein